MNHNNAASPIYVFVDVDDTLVRSAGGKRIPIPSTIQHVRRLHAQGATLYCWSSGGSEYARQSAEELGIAECFTAFLPKPNVFLDDLTMAEWPGSILVHPSNCGDRSLDEYREMIG
jgi:predicted HAD superfamily phosphohydrolase YqeG